MTDFAVKLVLLKIKEYVSNGKRSFVERTYQLKNGETKTYLDELLEIGLMNVSAAWSEVLSLKPKHYVEGPIIDRDNPSEKDVWIFKKKINENTVYIKLKVNEKRGTVCISFHMDRPTT